MKLWFLFFTLFLVALPAHALTMEEMTGEKTMTIEDLIDDYVDVPAGAIDWKTFGTTKEIPAQSKTEDGYDNYYTRPDFRPEVEALDGKEIKIKGYMFPLDGTEAQKNFLFGPFPLSCPFQYHVGPALVIEVHADNHPVTFDYEPVTLTGTLELVQDDPEYSTFYRLQNAKQVK